jgi:hypothetical protein
MGGTTARNDRMEAELTRWLSGLEPAATPVALRVRTFANLRDEAARPPQRLAWLRPALSSAASLSAVVLGLGFVAVLAVVSASQGHGTGGPGSAAPYVGGQPVLPGATGPGEAPVIQRGLDLSGLLILVATALAGLSIFLPRVQRLGRRIALGKVETTPGVALPLRRSVRSIPRVTWALVALGLLSALWTLWLVFQPNWMLPPIWLLAFSICMLPVTVSVPAVVAWRYPLADRSSRLLLLGTTATLGVSLVSLLTLSVYQAPAIGEPLGRLLMYVYGALLVTSSVALAAGLAGRSESMRRPPLWLAAVAIGAAFLIEMGPLLDMLIGTGGFAWSTPPIDLAGWVFAAACRWLELVGLLAIPWVGICALRRHGGSWGWRLVLAAGAFELIGRLPGILLYLYNGLLVYYTPFGAVGPGDFSTTYALAQWQSVTGNIAVVALVLALLTGLHPLPAKAPPAEPSTGESDRDATEGNAPAAPASAETPAI